MAPSDVPVVNAWTQWGDLETVVVGRADPKSCHLPHEPACHSEINDPVLAENIPWPGGCVKHSRSIEFASAQLDNLCAVLEAETVRVIPQRAFDTELQRTVEKRRTESLQNPTSQDKDGRVVQKGRIDTLRPTTLDWSKHVAGPHWDSASQYCGTCPRDTMITLGNTILEATMSKRSRYFEHLACREIALDLWRKDLDRVKIWSAPKPSMADSMYVHNFFDLSDEQRFEQMRSYSFCVNENEPVFDAADITRVGKDIFVQKSMTTNDSGIKWLTSHFPELRVHPLHFPYDLYPSHIDCTFVPLRPPSSDGGGDGLCLINPERPPLQSEMELWKKNGWKLLNTPLPAQIDRPPFSQSSYWLSMNLLSLSPTTVVIEENEIPLYDLLSEHGFDPITVPMRHMYDYGGAIHCSTWDIKRQDSCTDYFPNQEYSRSHLYSNTFTDIEVMDVSSDNGGFLLNPSNDFEVGTRANVLKRTIPGKAEVSPERSCRSGEGGSFAVKGDHSDGWSNKAGNTILNTETLVMESWETPYMEHLADLAAAEGGDVLEVGFGLALSGNRVQTHSKVRSHTIIEANHLVFEHLEKFAKDEAEAGRPTVVPVQGLWVDALQRLKEQGCCYDAILYDASPQNECEQHLHQFLFMNAAWELLRPGGRFVYCNLTSIGKLRETYSTWEDLWQKSQLPYLTSKLCGFYASKTSYTLFEFSEKTKSNRGECKYYMHDQALCPVCVKAAK